LLNIPEKQYIKCDWDLDEHYYFYFFEKYKKERDWVFSKSYTSICGHSCLEKKYEFSPVTQIDYPESEIIDYRKEDLLRFKDKIIDVEIYKDFPCPPILDTSFSIVFRARIIGECDLPLLRWNIGATYKDSVIAELIPGGTLVIGGKGKMMNFKAGFGKRPWDEMCQEEISNVVIENGVTHIGKRAFHNCHLDSITIPSSVTSRAKYVFNNSGLGDLYYNVLGIAAFFGKSTFRRGGDISITIPDSVFYIDEKLLSNFKRTAPSITISNPIPPRLAGDISGWIRKFNYGTLYVPKGSIDAYREAEGWKECKNMKPMK